MARKTPNARESRGAAKAKVATKAEKVGRKARANVVRPGGGKNPPNSTRAAQTKNLIAAIRPDDEQIVAVENAVDGALTSEGHNPAKDLTFKDFGYTSQSILGFLLDVKEHLKPAYLLKRTINRTFGNQILPLKRGPASAVINVDTVPA